MRCDKDENLGLLLQNINENVQIEEKKLIDFKQEQSYCI